MVPLLKDSLRTPEMKKATEFGHNRGHNCIELVVDHQYLIDIAISSVVGAAGFDLRPPAPKASRRHFQRLHNHLFLKAINEFPKTAI